MKLLKKIAVMAMAVVLAMGLTSLAFADDAAGEAPYTITIEHPEGHVYEVYQIFTGDLHGNVLSNVEWGDGVSPAFKAKYNSASDAAESIVGADNPGGFAETFADSLDQHLINPKAAVYSPTAQKYILSDLPAGYYLIKDKDGSLDGKPGTAYTDFILKVVQDVTVHPKAGAPEVTKKTKEYTESNGLWSDWQDAGDYDLGEEIPFKLEATLSASMDKYSSYKIVFHDTMSKGLSLVPGTLVAKLNGNPATEGADYTVKTESGVDGATLIEVTFPNVKGLGAHGKVTVEYKAKLNEHAVTGNPGNPNKVYLTYSNNPNKTESSGTTVEDVVTVFTYQLDIHKTDEAGNPLPGAGFTLYKVHPDGTKIQVGDELIIDAANKPLTTFTWKNLDSGNYELVESTTPQGYNTINPIAFSIHATYPTEGQPPALTNFHADGANFDGTVDSGVLVGTIINQDGAELPSTGGMGTTILYAVGIALILGAGIALVVRKRAR